MNNMKILLPFGFVCLFLCSLSFAVDSAGVANSKSEKADSQVVADKKTSLNVKDYKSFSEYVAIDEAGVKAAAPTIQTGLVKKILKEKGIEFTSKKRRASTKDGVKVAYQSPDEKGVSVLDRKTHRLDIYNTNGEIIRTVPLSKYPDGALAFSDTRVFAVKGGVGWQLGFEIYDLTGKLLKSIEKERIYEYMVSNNQKYLAVTAFLPESDVESFVLYDMDGNELLRHKVALGENSIIQFSQDDKYVLLKMPVYLVGAREKARKERKVYLFDIENKKMISEEDYAK